MKSGILRNDEGFDIVIDGQNLSFDDRREIAIARAAYCKSGKYKHQLCQVRVRATGVLSTVQADGRVI